MLEGSGSPSNIWRTQSENLHKIQKDFSKVLNAVALMTKNDFKVNIQIMVVAMDIICLDKDIFLSNCKRP